MAVVLFLLLRRFFGTVLLSILLETYCMDTLRLTSKVVNWLLLYKISIFCLILGHLDH